MAMDLQIQRRHKATCPDRHKGADFLKCKGGCRLWAYCFEKGKRVRFSLRTADLGRAQRKVQEIEQAGKPPKPERRKAVAAAIDDFLAHKGNRSSETLRKYKRHLRLLRDFCEGSGIVYLADLTLEALDPFVRQNRKTAPGWNKHIEHYRAFFEFAKKRKWCEENPAEEIEYEDLPEGEEIVPYTPDEVASMIAACDRIGKGSYERLRARAYVLLLRFTGMRISDVVTLSREHIQGGYIVKRAIKNKRWVRIKLEPVVGQALENLPHPKAAARDSRMFFAGQGSVRSLVKSAERLLWSVFEKSGVKDAYPHRFRHTFASELLAHGTPIEVVADLLGDSVDIVRRHYQKWMPAWQAKKDEASAKIGLGTSTKVPQPEKTRAN